MVLKDSCVLTRGHDDVFFLYFIVKVPRPEKVLTKRCNKDYSFRATVLPCHKLIMITTCQNLNFEYNHIIFRSVDNVVVCTRERGIHMMKY
jgi:hypothetical protein